MVSHILHALILSSPLAVIFFIWAGGRLHATNDDDDTGDDNANNGNGIGD